MKDDALDREPTWLTKKLVLALHAETLHRFGGSSGMRDEGRLESALDRPRNQDAYGEPSVFDLAAAYAYGIVRNRPFVDGNKRTGFLAARAFLFQNGYRLDPEEAETVRVMRQIAAGERSETALAEWLAKNADPH